MASGVHSGRVQQMSRRSLSWRSRRTRNPTDKGHTRMAFPYRKPTELAQGENTGPERVLERKVRDPHCEWLSQQEVHHATELSDQIENGVGPQPMSGPVKRSPDPKPNQSLRRLYRSDPPHSETWEPLLDRAQRPRELLLRPVRPKALQVATNRVTHIIDVSHPNPRVSRTAETGATTIHPGSVDMSGTSCRRRLGHSERTPGVARQSSRGHHRSNAQATTDCALELEPYSFRSPAVGRRTDKTYPRHLPSALGQQDCSSARHRNEPPDRTAVHDRLHRLTPLIGTLCCRLREGRDGHRAVISDDIRRADKRPTAHHHHLLDDDDAAIAHSSRSG